MTGSNRGHEVDVKLLSKYHVPWGSHTAAKSTQANGKVSPALKNKPKNGLPYGTNLEKAEIPNSNDVNNTHV